MTVRRDPLYAGVFLLAAGAVTLGVATGALDQAAVAGSAAALWPVALIALGAGLVLRRSPAALVAGVLAAALPGLALGASVVAAPGLRVPCGDVAVGTRQPSVRKGTFGSTGTVDLALSCGELSVTTQPGSAWRLETRDGSGRRTEVTADGGRLHAASGDRSFGPRPGGVGGDWDVVLPTDTTLDLVTELNAGRGRIDLAGARLGRLGLEVNAGDLRVDLGGASVERLALDVNAGSAEVMLPADAFTGDLVTSAGSLALCAPDQLGLRVRSTAALGSIDTGDLVLRGDAWETQGYAAAPFKADLAIEASVGSVVINPKGGCK